ncbi:hypothetical protein [Ligilactobacillus ruminis]|uniref:hypothetical protein n=1 Tax=Ligilactobacillus ruminis TaxID=1623 RepID=UPI0022E0FEBE|nr:hypothetical protein [Ligilactobacillus ruminis]
MNKNYFFQAAILLNQFIQALTQIYGQKPFFGIFVRKRQSFCQMQLLINQRANLSVKFTAKFFRFISIMEGARSAY